MTISLSVKHPHSLVASKDDVTVVTTVINDALKKQLRKIRSQYAIKLREVTLLFIFSYS